MLELTPILVLLIIFGFIYGVVNLAVRKKERMALLEKGTDPKAFYAEPLRITTLKWGLFLIGIAIGIFLGYLVWSMQNGNTIPESTGRRNAR